MVGVGAEKVAPAVSQLLQELALGLLATAARGRVERLVDDETPPARRQREHEIGRASCRERVL